MDNNLIQKYAKEVDYLNNVVGRETLSRLTANITFAGFTAPSDIIFYRLQCDSEGQLRAYIAQGEVLDVRTRSFGGIGVFAIPEMGRFYRHVLIQKRYPHHGKALFEVFQFLGVKDIACNRPKNLPYPTENPWS